MSWGVSITFNNIEDKEFMSDSFLTRQGKRTHWQNCLTSGYSVYWNHLVSLWFDLHDCKWINHADFFGILCIFVPFKFTWFISMEQVIDIKAIKWYAYKYKPIENCEI